MKAIAIAASQGQKVFTINQSNASVAIPLLSHRASVIDEVAASVAAGKEVTIHQSAITANGWTGAGYTVVDRETGAGAYLIEGGARGAIFFVTFVLLVIAILLPLFLFSAGFIGIGGLILAGGGAVWNFASFIKELGQISTFEEFNQLAAFTSIKAFASIAFGLLGWFFYGSLAEFGPITALTPYSLFNAAFLFLAGLFR